VKRRSEGSFSTKQPTGRFISAEQVAALMVFLCGPDAGDITARRCRSTEAGRRRRRQARSK
jgi:hypothetical protein